jgi:hypothetical protein
MSVHHKNTNMFSNARYKIQSVISVMMTRLQLSLEAHRKRSRGRQENTKLPAEYMLCIGPVH